MIALPNNWVDEDRAEIVEAIVDGMVAEMTFESIRQSTWDMLYDDMIFQEWADIWMYAEKYAPEVLEKFQSDSDPSF